MSTPEIERLEKMERNLKDALHQCQAELLEAREALLTFKVGDVVEARRTYGSDPSWRRAKIVRVNVTCRWERYTVVFVKKNGEFGVQPVRCDETTVRALP